ncbi:hypothetical protein FO519_005821 [Halicephalobus sp. NKZ332]|nr:hypothetical protein FO519_005821 [Halicephalobus sp. NKZ332]
MRSDQTLKLVQLYHNNYPEISKHTQDIEGRRRKMEIWKNITEELNSTFDTQFSVEQYKKKLQNVQCTSRQKLQTGKRPSDATTHKFSPAETEFIRLFESSGNREISPNLLSGIKVEDFIQQLGAAVNESRSETGSRSGEATPGDGNSESLPSQDFLNQQLLLALGPILNSSNLLPTFGNMDRQEEQDSGDRDQGQQASPAATSSSSSDFGGLKKSENIQEVKKESGSAKRKKRKAIPMIPTIGNPQVEENDFSGFMVTEMIKLQRQILANQELILEELRLQRPQKQMRLDEEIGTLLGSKLDRLCDCLVTITEGCFRNSASQGFTSPKLE